MREPVYIFTADEYNDLCIALNGLKYVVNNRLFESYIKCECSRHIETIEDVLFNREKEE